MKSALRKVILFALLAMLASACGQPTGNGMVIGVRPAAVSDARTSVFEASSIDQMLGNESTYATSVDVIQENAMAFGLLPIDTTLTVRQAEHLATLQLLGQSIIQSRLTAISKVRQQIANDRLLSYSQRYGITSRLDRATAGLNSMQVKIARDLLVDQTRADVTAVAAFRVFGLLLPQAHLLVAAYDLVQVAAIYANQHNNLQQALYNSSLSGQSAIAAQAILDDLARQVATASRYGSTASYQVNALTAAAYPGNRGMLKVARQTVTAGKDASSRAASDVSQLHAILGV